MENFLKTVRAPLTTGFVAVASLLVFSCGRVKETNADATVGQPSGNVAPVAEVAPPPKSVASLAPLSFSPLLPKGPSDVVLAPGNPAPKVVSLQVPPVKSLTTLADVERFALGQKNVFKRVVGVAQTDTLSMRARPNSASDVLARIPANAMYVKQIGTPVLNGKTSWIPVEFGGKQGFVNAAYLDYLDQASRNSSFARLEQVLGEKPELANPASASGSAFLRMFKVALEERNPVMETAEWPVKLASEAVSRR